MKQILALALLALVSTRPAAAQKFRADDPVWHDDDAFLDVKEVRKRSINDQYDFLKNTFGLRVSDSPIPAMNANTLGEVPDSSWFQNRHGFQPMSTEQLVRGPNTGNGPAMEAPWTVIAAKTEGVTPGFRIRDSRGDVYFIKFDPLQHPEMATAAEVISTKFFYALGYNVPENYIALFDRSQLALDQRTKLTDSNGKQRRLTESDLNAILARIPKTADGRYRALASRMLEGTPVGPFKYAGTRSDDPNDVIPHEHRRELRGLRVFAAWLNHDDSRAINTLDTVVTHEERGYVRHYLIDFGSTLGSGSLAAQKPRAGWEYLWDASATFKRIATLGFWDRPWVHVDYPDLPSIGRFESEKFEPKEWRPEYPNPSFEYATDEDSYWAARIVMAFSDDDIRAIVHTGQLSDPTAEAYLVETLIQRRDKIGRYWLTRRSSFNNFSIVDGDLRFDHLASKYGFSARPDYQVKWFGFDVASETRTPVEGDVRGSRAPYLVAEIGSVEGTVSVYVRNAGDSFQIVGVER